MNKKRERDSFLLNGIQQVEEQAPRKKQGNENRQRSNRGKQNKKLEEESRFKEVQDAEGPQMQRERERELWKWREVMFS